MPDPDPTDLDVIVRDLLREFINKRWAGSVNAAAKDLGIPQRTLARFHSGKQGGKLELFSKILSGLKTDPISFLVGHEAFKHMRPVWRQQRYTAQHERIHRFFEPAEVEEVFSLMELARSLGLHDEIRSVVKAILEIARHGRARRPPLSAPSHAKQAKSKRKTS